MTAAAQLEIGAAPAPAMQPAKDRVLLVDLSALFWRAWHSSGDGAVSKAGKLTREFVEACHQGKFQGVLTALCCDRGRSFRKDIKPSYKANRPEKDLMVIGELRQVEADLTAAGYLLLGADGFEGDDVIATACAEAIRRGHPVTIASPDKDILQLLALSGPNGEELVTVLRTHSMRVVDRADFISAYGIPPFLLGDWLALAGDKSDNVDGVPGVGEKTASAMLSAFPGLGFVIEAAESGALAKATGVKAGQVRAVAQNVEGLRLDRKLVELRRDAPIDFEEIYQSREATKPEVTSTQEDDPMPPAAELTDAPEATQPPTAATAPVPTQGADATAEKPQPAATSTALVQYQGPFELALEPTSLGVAMTLADKMWESRLYGRFPHKNALLAVIGRGRELGIGAFAALDMFHWIDDAGNGSGSLTLKAHTIAALAERDPNCEYIMLVESDAEKATYEFKHKKHPEAKRFTYTVQQAVDAGRCELAIKPRDWTIDQKTGKPGPDRRGNWDKIRPEMIRKTCLTQGVKVFFPNSGIALYGDFELDPEVA